MSAVISGCLSLLLLSIHRYQRLSHIVICGCFLSLSIVVIYRYLCLLSVVICGHYLVIISCCHLSSVYYLVIISCCRLSCVCLVSGTPGLDPRYSCGSVCRCYSCGSVCKCYSCGSVCRCYSCGSVCRCYSCGSVCRCYSCGSVCRSIHVRDCTPGVLVATLPGAWRHGVGAGTGRSSVSIV